jgi:L-aspartate oxidase
VHGANRLASNSLLEAAVFGKRAGEAARDATTSTQAPIAATAPPRLLDETRSALRRRMTAQAGVTRNARGMSELLAWIDAQRAVQGDELALVAARLIASAALARRESRGAHFRSDFPTLASEGVHSRVRHEVASARIRAA